ncbi:MAG: hypothetical protein Q8Q90_01900 [bacterium]|nr:hypothetical protein [bacterium]
MNIEESESGKIKEGYTVLHSAYKKIDPPPFLAEVVGKPQIYF